MHTVDDAQCVADIRYLTSRIDKVNDQIDCTSHKRQSGSDDVSSEHFFDTERKLVVYLCIAPLSADGLRVGCCGIPIMTAVGPRDWFFSTGKINQTKTPVSPILMTMSEEKVMYDGIMSLPMRQWPSCTLIPAWGVAMHQTAIPPKHPMVMNMPAIHIMSCLRSRTTGKRAMCILSR
jgi:hypothetical protein